MPKPPIQLKRSGTASATPSSLEHGELALNYADSKVFFKTASNTISSFTFQAYALSSHTHAASDITSGTFDAARIANDSITYAKLQNVSATDRLLGRSSAGAGDVEEITCTATGRAIIGAASEAAARSAISVQPTASPAFTGAATVTNDGNVVPLTVTNSGTANSFVVNDASGDTTPFVIDASGNVGIGTSSPGAALDVGSGNLRFSGTAQRITGDFSNATISNRLMFQSSTSNGNTSVRAIANGTATTSNFAAHNGSDANNTSFIAIQANPTETIVNSGSVGTGTNLPLTFYTGGAAQVQISTGGQLLVTAGSVSACGVAFSGDPDTGIAQLSAAGANTLSICTNSAERVRVDASGNVGIGSGGEASNKITVAGTYPTSGTVTRAMLCSGQIPSGSTVFGDGFVSLIGTVAASFTCANLRHYVAGQGGFGASSAVTNQFGFVAESSLTGATNNYGFYSDIASASNRWNFYAAGSAKNYFNGETLIGTTTDNGAYLLQVNSQIYATNATIATSDARFKTNVESLTDATAVIEALRPVAFDFIPHAERNFATERQVGLIAQEAQAALAGTDYADSVVAQCGDHLGLAYEKLVPVLIKALQESNARIAALEERLNHA